MRYLNERKFDIVFIQETHSLPEDVKVWENEWGGKIYASHGTNESKGVGVWLRKNATVKVINWVSDTQGRYIVMNILYEGQNYTLANLYAPNNDDPNFFKTVFAGVESQPNDFKIIGGDFNLILDKDKDLWGAVGGNHAHQASIQYVKQYMHDENMVDIWRDQHDDALKYTFMKQRPSPYFARLDFFLVSKTLVPFVKNSNIGSMYIADHSTPTLSIAPNTTPRGRGYWKLNQLLLDNDEYKQKVCEIIEKVINDDHPDVKLTWEMIKMEIRGYSIQYSSYRKKCATQKLKDLEQKINTLEDDLLNVPNNMDIFNEIAKTKAEIREIEDAKTKSSMFRTRKSWMQFGEKNSAYFFALEKNNYNRKCINELKLPDGSTSTDFKTIMNEQKRFYDELV